MGVGEGSISTIAMLTEHGTGLTRRLSGKAERAWANFLRARSDRRASYWMHRYYRLAHQFENQAVFPSQRTREKEGMVELPDIRSDRSRMNSLKHTRMNKYTDTDRLTYLLQFIEIDDVGDDIIAPGIVVHTERMEEGIGLGKYDGDLFGQGRGGNPCLCKFGDDLRTVIDRAIEEHGMPTCPVCNGTCEVDSGGETPWGHPIAIPCPSCTPQPQEGMMEKEGLNDE